MDKACLVSQTPVYKQTHTLHVHLLYVVAGGEVLHVGGTVECRVYVIGQLVEAVRVGEVTTDNTDALVEHLFVNTVEIVEEERAQTFLGCEVSLAAQHAIDGARLMLQQFVEHVNAQIAGGSCEQHVADGLHLALAQGFERIAVEHVGKGRLGQLRRFADDQCL